VSVDVDKLLTTHTACRYKNIFGGGMSDKYSLFQLLGRYILKLIVNTLNNKSWVQNFYGVFVLFI